MGNLLTTVLPAHGQYALSSDLKDMSTDRTVEEGAPTSRVLVPRRHDRHITN